MLPHAFPSRRAAGLPHFRSCRSAAPGASILLFGGVLELALGHAGDEDVARAGEAGGGKGGDAVADLDRHGFDDAASRLPQFLALADQIGRECCRERVCTYLSFSVGAITLKKKQTP